MRRSEGDTKGYSRYGPGQKKIDWRGADDTGLGRSRKYGSPTAATAYGRPVYSGPDHATKCPVDCCGATGAYPEWNFPSHDRSRVLSSLDPPVISFGLTSL
jgi:hypothetical protein